MKKLMILLMMFTMTMTLSSCVVTAHAQDEVYTNDDVDISVVLSDGVPYYYDGHLVYWLYNNWYYYRYWYNNQWYYYRYSRPFPMYRGWHFKPHHTHKPVYRHKPNVRHPQRPNTVRRNTTPNRTVRPPHRVGSANSSTRSVPRQRPNINRSGNTHHRTHRR